MIRKLLVVLTFVAVLGVLGPLLYIVGPRAPVNSDSFTSMEVPR